MQFHEVRFPAALSFGSVGGPERRTEIVTLANGFEERNSPWAHSRRRYDAGLGLRSLDDIDRLIAFFEARRGQLFGFRWKDWSDFKSCAPSRRPAPTDQVLVAAGGSGRRFQLVRAYGGGASSYERPIRKPVAGTVVVAVDGVSQHDQIDFEVEAETGIVTFAAVPPDGANVSAGFEFDVPVRFDADRIQSSVATFNAGEIPNVPVVEIRI